jgi:hypothetical protein
MLDSINTVDDVKEYASLLVKEGTSFHPDDDFHDYIDLETGDLFYSDSDADHRNKLMEECFEICEKEKVDIYEIMTVVYLRETELDKIIGSGV